jgi:DMSO/TMAO reductase YedYZ molybdopterin-dependent catalytic subunit
VLLAGGREIRVTLPDLHSMPRVDVEDCYIVSTGHGTSGPFRFTGARLADVLRIAGGPLDDLIHIDVISADGFGCRLNATELDADSRPPLLAWSIDGAPMRRAQGLVRLIVPSKTQDALRQVKWVARIEQVPR